MSKWPELPIIGALGAIFGEPVKGDLSAMPEDKILEALKKLPLPDSLCTSDAAVICSNAAEEGEPVHIAANSEVYLKGKRLLIRTDVQPEKNFAGCTKAADGRCRIVENYQDWILDDEWKAYDSSSGQGDGREMLSREYSYMLCKEHCGIIRFFDDGQAFASTEEILADAMWREVSDEGIDMISNFELTKGYAKATGIGVFDESGEMIGIYPHYVIYYDKEMGKYKSDGGITFGFGHWISQREYELDASEREIIDEYNLAGQFTPPHIGKKSYPVPGAMYMPVEEAKSLLRADIQVASDAVNKFIRKHADKKIILEQHQFEALVSFTYQHGVGCWNEIEDNTGDNKDANKADEKPKYNLLPTLLLEGTYKDSLAFIGAYTDQDTYGRRLDEAKLFTEGTYPEEVEE